MHAANLLTDRARLSPDKVALIETATGRRWTYAALNGRSNQAARLLQTKYGIQQGDRVSLLAHNHVVYLDLLYGLAKIGAIFAPLNWRLVASELAYIVNDCGSRLLIVGDAFAETAAAMLPETPQVETCLSIETYEAELAQMSAAEVKRPSLSPDDPLCILYTSGTTGRPKGALIPHRQLLWNALNTIVSWQLDEQDITPVFTPIFHAGGLFAFLVPVLTVGGTVLLTEMFDPERSLQLIQDERCTVILGVPTLFQMWQQTARFETAVFDHVRFFISGGAPCPPDLIQHWRTSKQVIFRQGYGLTEVGPNCFSMTDEESVEKVGTVGKPIMNIQTRIVDSDGHDLPADEVGELWIWGPHVSNGYWQNPEATASSIVDGWFRTGDMARYDADGFFTIVGRFKDMIISGGENIYAAEVEAVICEHPAVAEAALIGRPDAKWGEVGVMITVLAANQTATTEELRDFCRQRLAAYKVPKEIIFVDALPYSPYGKVQKPLLKQQFIENTGP